MLGGMAIKKSWLWGGPDVTRAFFSALSAVLKASVTLSGSLLLNLRDCDEKARVKGHEGTVVS